MNRRTASPRSRLSHRRASSRFVGRLQAGDRGVAELARVRLAARHAPIEEDVVLAVADERLGPDPDGERRPPLELLRLPLHRVEPVLVDVAGFRGEVVPDEALDRVVERAHAGALVRVGDHRLEDLEPRHVEGLVLGGVDPLDREAEEAVPGRIAGGDRERHRVHAGDGEDPSGGRASRAKAHGAPLRRASLRGIYPERVARRMSRGTSGSPASHVARVSSRDVSVLTSAAAGLGVTH